MDSTAEKMEASLREGDAAPDFTLPTDTGSISLSDFKGDKNVVVYFYPKDDTPGCTCQAKAARDEHEHFRTANTVVVGISKDDAKSHAKFRQKYGLQHILACDTEGEICQAYGAWGEKNMYGKKYMGIQRNVYLIDKAGKLVKQWRNVKADGSIEAALDEARKLN